MNKLLMFVLLLGSILEAYCPLAAAQFGATAKVEQPFISSNPEDPTASATVVELESRSAASETLEDIFLEVPGTRIQRTGFDGAFSGLNLRGGNFEHTTVIFENMPIHSVDGSAFDFSVIPLSLLERVEVYRGGAPLWLGASGIGGVVRLIPRKPKNLLVESRVGAGSFDTYSAQVTSSRGSTNSAVSFLATAGFKHTDGDFPFVHDRGTLLNQGNSSQNFSDSTQDDQTVRRQNGKQDEGWAFGRANWKMLHGDFEMLLMGYGRSGGVVGPVIQTHTHVRQKQFRFFGGFNWRWESKEHVHANPLWRFEWSNFVHTQYNDVTDLNAEIYFVPRKSEDRGERWLTRFAAQWNPLAWLTFTSVQSFQLESYHPEDTLQDVQPNDSTRKTGNMGLELLGQWEFGLVRAQLRPSAQLRVSSASLHEIETDSLGQNTNPILKVPSFRVGSAFEFWRLVSLVGSFYYSSRMPTMVELFGNRGFLRGNTDLKPEKSLGADLGLLFKGQTSTFFPKLGAELETRIFLTKINHLIRYVGTAQGALIPFNIDRATIQGLEVGGKGNVGPVQLQSAATFMKTRDEALKRSLPFRPQLQLYTKVEGSITGSGFLDEVRLYSDLQYTSTRFYDEYNINIIPYHLIWGLGTAVHLFKRKIQMRFSANNLLNQASFDLVGFPLPGRFFMFDLTFHEDMDS